MNFDWLFGPRYRGEFIRSLVLDVEVLKDLAALVEHELRAALPRVPVPRTASGEPAKAKESFSRSYTVRGRPIPEEALAELSVPDRNQLVLEVSADRWCQQDEAEYFDLRVKLTVVSPTAFVHLRINTFTEVDLPGDDYARIQKLAQDYLYSHGRQRPSLVRRRAFWAASPVLVAAIGWIWATVAGLLSPPFHLIIVGALGALAFLTLRFVASMTVPAADARQNSLRYRAESRVTTNARRAESKRDIRVAAWTVLGTLVAGAIGLGVTQWWNVTFPADLPSPSISSLSDIP